MVASFTVYFNIKKNILNTLLDGLSPRHLQFFIFQCRDSGPASTIQIIHFFNIRDCFVFKPVVIYCYMYTQSVQHTIWSRFHKFQSSQSKTRENIFHFFLRECIEPSCLIHIAHLRVLRKFQIFSNAIHVFWKFYWIRKKFLFINTKSE